jgi:hypothetical protein
MAVQKTQLVEPCVCALRHITNRHSEQLLAQEQVRTINGLSIITQLMLIKPRSWSVIKAVLGVVRNFCSNQLNDTQLAGLFVYLSKRIDFSQVKTIISNLVFDDDFFSQMVETSHAYNDIKEVNIYSLLLL